MGELEDRSTPSDSDVAAEAGGVEDVRDGASLVSEGGSAAGVGSEEGLGTTGVASGVIEESMCRLEGVSSEGVAVTGLSDGVTAGLFGKGEEDRVATDVGGSTGVSTGDCPTVLSKTEGAGDGVGTGVEILAGDSDGFCPEGPSAARETAGVFSGTGDSAGEE